jgi:hypothetical protein
MGQQPDLTISLAYAFLSRCRRLGVVIEGISSRHYAWKRLESETVRQRVRIILAPWFRRGERPRRRIVTAWRFADGSHVVYLPRAKYHATLEVLSSAGLTAVMMRDSRAAVAAALRAEHPVYEDLVCAYIELHGGLPPLDPAALMGALQAESQAIRVEAISNLGTAQSANREAGQAGGSASAVLPLGALPAATPLPLHQAQ